MPEHRGDENKTKLLCDYKVCSRHKVPFFRYDHFRDHYRIYHKEDLLRRGTKVDEEYWASRAPFAIFSGWWRCSRCLVRFDLEASGYTCHKRGGGCEKERQRYRKETARPAQTPARGRRPA